MSTADPEEVDGEAKWSPRPNDPLVEPFFTGLEVHPEAVTRSANANSAGSAGAEPLGADSTGEALGWIARLLRILRGR